LKNPPSSLLAFDLGRKRTGVAYGTMILSQARALGVIQAQGDQRMKAFASYIQTWQPHALVVGVPYHPDGAPNENTLFAKNIAKQLKNHFKLDVFEIDERYSTTEAIGVQQSEMQNPQSTHQDVDALSACVILNQFFSQWNSHAISPL